jgi:hypothetical protein
MRLLVREQCDLAPETVERALLQGPADEVRADKKRERDRAEDSSTDREPQPCLQ